MIGIYLITNNINGKKYVGQSNDIERRYKEHCSPTRWMHSKIPVEYAIHKYGKENFTLSILEECPVEKLNERETFWIRTLNTVEDGYNCNEGGGTKLQGANNPNAKLTESQVMEIRLGYMAHERKKDIYEPYKNIITWGAFEKVFEGISWPDILPEVFTEENKKYYSVGACKGENGSSAKFTNDEVYQLRQKYVTSTAKQLYKDYQDRCSYSAFQHLLTGVTYSELPVYHKKTQKWYYNGERPAPTGNRGKTELVKYRSRNYTDDEVLQYREYYINHTAKETYEYFNINISFDSFQGILTGKSYTHLPVYSKTTKKWINK